MSEKSEARTNQVEWEVVPADLDTIELVLDDGENRVTFPMDPEESKEIGRALFEVPLELEELKDER